MPTISMFSLVKIFKPRKAARLYGRNAGYPAPPVQTPACSFSAPGSSVVLASAVQGGTFKQTPALALLP